jgi:chlorobactene glucosyltransferase
LNEFWLQQQAGLVFFLLMLLAIALSNLRFLRRIEEYPLAPRLPRVSVLVPARDEAENIYPCALSLLAQDHPDFEVLILYDEDDPSDRTEELLADLLEVDSRLRLIRGKPLPPGWLGKHWACHQLAEAAEGELLLFTDADTRHHPSTLRDATAALLAEGADLLSALPQQIVGSWGEKLVVPVLAWSILSFLPLGLAYRLHLPGLSASSGPFMLFRKQAYDQIGGHAAVRDDVVDDLALARRIKAQGLRWRLVDGGSRISCRMYHGLREVFEGFSKNFFAVFQCRVLLFLFVWLWLGIVFLGPLILLALRATEVPIPGLSLSLAAAAVGCSLLLWGITDWRFGFSLYLTPLYPITILLAVTIALRSLALTLSGRATWKGRRLIKPKVRW